MMQFLDAIDCITHGQSGTGVRSMGGSESKLKSFYTLNDLINSGDRIIKMEAVLSGSLSYIFNTFGNNGHTFSQMVEEAMALGYTEPDPRIDLNGIDLRRKLIILAREAGSKIESDEVIITSVLSENCQNTEFINSNTNSPRKSTGARGCLRNCQSH